jgi:cytochrome o ubiquinol oxidase subunit III
MSTAEHVLGPSAPGIPLSQRGPAPTRVVAGFGFWLFLLSDIVIFAALFAAYAVLSGETAGGPSGADLFNQKHVFIETLCLLASSVTCGFGSIAVQRAEAPSVYFWMALTSCWAARFSAWSWGSFGTCSHKAQDRRIARFCPPSLRSSAPTDCTSLSVCAG